VENLEKEIIRGGPVGIREVENIEFEIIDDIDKCNIAYKFNLYYIQSIGSIVNSIKIDRSGSDIIQRWMNINKKIIYIIENKGIMEDFETVKLERRKLFWDCQKRKVR